MPPLTIAFSAKLGNFHPALLGRLRPALTLDHLKKSEMATEAERLLKGSGWLPEVLRRADLVTFDGEAVGEKQGDDADEPDDVDLPVFLTAGLPESAASMMAAE